MEVLDSPRHSWTYLQGFKETLETAPEFSSIITADWSQEIDSEVPSSAVVG